MLAWTAMKAKKKLAFGSVYMPLLWTNLSSIFLLAWQRVAARDMQLDVRKWLKIYILYWWRKALWVGSKVWILVGFSLLFVVLSMGSVSGIWVSWKPGNAPSTGRNCGEDGKGQWFQKVKLFNYVVFCFFVFFFSFFFLLSMMWRWYWALDMDVDMSQIGHVADDKNDKQTYWKSEQNRKTLFFKIEKTKSK